MKLGHIFDRASLAMVALFAAMSIALMPQIAVAQEADTSAGSGAESAGAEAAATDAASPEAGPAAEAASSYTPMAPTEGKGMPTAFEDDALKSMTFQDQYSADGQYALWMHDVILLPVITVISLFVLALLLWVVVRYRKSANPVPSKTTHNTAIEVIWTIVPVIILVIIAVPSISLLARQYETPPENAITIKATGYQWYWTYTYPDNGDFEIVSNMLTEEEAEASGEVFQLAVDNRMVVPAGVPLRIQTTAADVIHAFAVPSLWFKMDAVPGRLNEKLLTIDEPGVYYGQCSELCGAKHAYMPLAVEALPMAEYEAWVRSQPGGTVSSDAVAEAAPEAEATDVDAETSEEAAS